MTKLSLGISPCPNDTFIFEPMLSKKIVHTFDIDLHLADVQLLNEWALNEQLLVTKISFGVYNQIKHNYQLLNTGSALGFGVGPLLIANQPKKTINNSDVVAVPGQNTTANFLFKWAYPNIKNIVYLRYDEIENFVLQNKGLGVIIHENRFTYYDKGLHLVTDLGKLWEEKTQMPIPLGGIVAHKCLGNDTIKAIDKCINQSLQFSFQNYKTELPEFITQNAMEMSKAVMRKHIDLYVNQYSLNLGTLGRKAIETLIQHQ